MLIRFKKSREVRPPLPTTLRLDLESNLLPSVSQTIHQPTLAREAAVKIAVSVLGAHQQNVLSQLDILRKTRASRGGVGAPLQTIGGVDVPHIYDPGSPTGPEGYRIGGRSHAERD